jgi:hypothetical protein
LSAGEVKGMDMWTGTCKWAGIIFGVTALLFAVLREKGAMLIAGFNTMPKEKRELYDKKRMSRDQRNAFALWAVILEAGGILSDLTMSQNAAILAIIIWLVLFFREVHVDEEKAFGKYRMK